MEMASLIRISVTIFIFSILAAKGFSASSCSRRDILITTSTSGKQIKGKPEWIVDVVNNCSCAISQVTLSCKGFQTVKDVDPSVFVKKKGDVCLIKAGQVLGPLSHVQFSYAWDPPAMLVLLSFVLSTCT